MERTSVQKLARVLRILVIITFVCNILAMIWVPMAYYRSPLDELQEDVTYWTYGIVDDDYVHISYAVRFFFAWLSALCVPAATAFSLFFWFCGSCTAIILWQAKQVLDMILKGEPFSLRNAANLKRAAVCCFLISAAALIRLVGELAYYRNIIPLFNYNALFVPLFFMAGLLCMVMSALFRQAAELKAENDLTI